LTGFEAIAQIRAAGSKARIVMLTANIQQSSRDRAAEMGVYFVQKPATEAAVHLMLAHFNGVA
jgi:CheY-like chemotaxis protein